MEKTIPSNWHIVCSKEHEGHKCRSIVVDKAQGIKAIYCQQDNKIVKMLFKKSRGWEDGQALEYTKKFLADVAELSCISVDQEPEFIKVIATKRDGETMDLNPNSPSFIFTGKEEMPDDDIDKGGQGSGNFGHAGRAGERGGSAPSDVAQTAMSMTMSGGGASVNLKGKPPKDGFMVSPYKDREKTVTFKRDRAEMIKAFKDYQSNNKDFIQQKNHYLGSWKNQGKVYLDISVNVADKEEAMKMAKEHNQLAIWDVKNKQEVTVGKANGVTVYLIPLDATDAEIEEIVDAMLAEPDEAEKGGQGSGNFGHFGIEGQRGGSMPTVQMSELSEQQKNEFNSLSQSQQKDYMQHRNAGMDHDTAVVLAEPSLVEAGVKKNLADGKVVTMDLTQCLLIPAIESAELAEKRLREEGINFDTSVVVGANKVFSSGSMECAQWIEQRKTLVILPCAVIGEVEKGGAGSGNFGHAGRAGERGGSASSDSGNQGSEKVGVGSKVTITGTARGAGKSGTVLRYDSKFNSFIVDVGENESIEVHPDNLRVNDGENQGGKEEAGISQAEAKNWQAQGIKLASQYEWDGKAILEVSGNMLEDANFHSEAKVVRELSEKLAVGEVPKEEAQKWQNDGVKIASRNEWDGVALLEIAGNALEDANFHTEAKVVREMSAKVQQEYKSEKAIRKGGAGSGNFGHAGREGERGGSAPSDSAGAGDNANISEDERVKDGVAGGADKTKFEVVKETLSNGHTMVYKKTEDGTHYSAEYPDKLIDNLQQYRENGTRLRFESGDMKTGQSWGDRESGRIGRSTGTIKIPLVVHNERSMGGGALGSIVKVTEAKGGREVWTHSAYKEPKDGFNDINKGGQGSGNFGHAGRQGERGGSAPSEGAGAGGEGGGKEPESQATNDAGTTMENGVRELGKDALETFKQDGGEFGEDMSDRVGSFEKDGESFNIIASEDDAIAIAEEQVRNDLENEPELFNQEWLQNYVSMSETDIRIIAGEEADAYVEDMDDDRLLEESNKQSDYDAIQEKIDEEEGKDEPDQAKIDAWEKEKEGVVDDAREAVREERDTYVSDALTKDPKDYFVNELGAYTEEDLMKQPFIRIDIDNATEDAVAEDGWAHFLSRYDGNYESTENGAVYFRRADKRAKHYKVRKVKIGKSCNRILEVRPTIVVKTKSQEEVSNQEMVICKTDDDKRMVYGVFLYPEEADHDGDVISADDIEKVAHGFMADYRTIDEMHKDVIEADIVESALAWKDGLEIYGEKKVKKGTWFGAVKVHDEKVWDKVKSGLYKGFSVRISGVREEWTEKIEKGGAGSGNFGHSGRAGERGGSAPADGGSGVIEGTHLPVSKEAENIIGSYESHLKDNKVSPKEIAGYKNVVSSVAETIATHDGSRTVEGQHIAEAIQYAEMDRTDDRSFNEISPKVLLDTRMSGLEVYDRMNELGVSDRLDKDVPQLRDDIRNLASGLTQDAKAMFGLAVREFASKDGNAKLNKDELKEARQALQDAKKESKGGQIDTEAMAIGIQNVYGKK
jgi:hypothetical protein